MTLEKLELVSFCAREPGDLSKTPEQKKVDQFLRNQKLNEEDRSTTLRVKE